MKKHILFAFFTSLVLVLSGCGSNDKVDSGTGSVGFGKVIQAQAEPMIMNGQAFSVHIPVTKSVGEEYAVSMTNFQLTVPGCDLDRITMPANVSMNGALGSTEVLEISGRFQTPCSPSRYELAFDQTVSKGGKSKTERVTLDSQDAASSPDGSGYRFYNVDAPKISVPAKSYHLRVQLIKDNFVAPGKTINMRIFSSVYGNLDNYQTSTGTDGYADFLYTSPDPLPANGVSAILTAEFTDDANRTISKDIALQFDSNGSTTDGLDTNLPIVVIPLSIRNVVLKNNSQTLDIKIKTYKDGAVYGGGEVMVELPSEVLNGVDVGSFSAYSVAVNDQGEALFHYTGPANLQALISSGHSGALFKFYHTENSATENRQPLSVSYQPTSDYVPMDYRIAVTATENDFSMGIPNLTKTFNVVLQKSDGSTLSASDATVTSVTIQTENASVAQLYDEGAGTLVNSLALSNSFSNAFIVKSKKLSGIVPMRAKIEFDDVNGDHKSLQTIINLRVMSGPPSAISISYVSTGQDSNRSKYIERFAISVTDEYGNSVNTRPYISVGAIAGYAVDGGEADGNETNETKRLFYGRNDIQNNIANGTINAGGDADPSTTQFEEAIRTDVFKYVNPEGVNTDKLVVFGAGKNYEAMGKWDFSRVTDSILNLEDDYYGSDRSGLYYAVGHNYYQDQCLADGREWIGTVSSDSYQLDDRGTVIAEYRYDYHLSGKDVLVWVNLDGIQPDTGKKTRIGEVTKHTLRSAGLEQRPTAGYTFIKNTSGYATFAIHHKNAPEWYRNAHFGGTRTGSCTSVTLVSTSNSYDARTCNNGRYGDGTSYITYHVTAPATEDCTINFENVAVSDEF